MKNQQYMPNNRRQLVNANKDCSISSVVIIANGEFPTHIVPLKVIEAAETLVCCDGAAAKLCAYGLIPDFIVGDMDSLSDGLQKLFADRLYKIGSQETNDMTKAVDFCLKRGAKYLKIIGAGGMREDHTIANIALLAEYASKCNVEMITNYGTFIVATHTITLKSAVGQQISVFSLTPQTTVFSDGLLYPLNGLKLDKWWRGCLNEATGTEFTLKFEKGTLIVFLEH